MQGRALVNASVRPMDLPEDEAQAILWVGGAIKLVGSTRAVEAEARRRGIEVEDLHGRVVLPGFVDAHTHFLHVGVKKLRPDLRGAKSKAEAFDRVRRFLHEHPGREPVIAEGWDESEWKEAERPTAREVDALAADAGAADRPLVLRRICGHVAVAGSRARPGIQARFGAAAVGADGLVLEAASLYLNEAMPVPPDKLDWALQEASRDAHRLGVTAVGDYSQAPYRAALLRAAANGTLAVRVASSIYVQQLQDEVKAGFRTGRVAPGPRGMLSEWLQDGGLKVFLDGSLGGHTAHLREPYLDGPPPGATCTHPHPRGTPIWTDRQVLEHFQSADRAGIQIHAHAIGDAAIDQGLDAFERLDPSSTGEPNPLRHRFEHYEIHHDDQLRRTARLGIVSSSQPNFVGEWSAKGGMYHDRLGERFRLNNRFQTLKRAGIQLAFGSDGMPFGPLVGLQSAVEHPEHGERMVPEEAVWHYTNRAAWSLHWPTLGTLKEGHHADLVVLDRVDLKGRPVDWRVAQTYTGGIARLPLPA